MRVCVLLGLYNSAGVAPHSLYCGGRLLQVHLRREGGEGGPRQRITVGSHCALLKAYAQAGQWPTAGGQAAALRATNAQLNGQAAGYARQRIVAAAGAHGMAGCTCTARMAVRACLGSVQRLRCRCRLRLLALPHPRKVFGKVLGNLQVRSTQAMVGVGLLVESYSGAARGNGLCCYWRLGTRSRVCVTPPRKVKLLYNKGVPPKLAKHCEQPNRCVPSSP